MINNYAYKQTDLEFYRWQVHNQYFANKKKFPGLPREHHFVSMLPRQYGKSTMLSKMINFLSKSRDNDSVKNMVVYFPNGKMKDHFVSRFSSDPGAFYVSAANRSTQLMLDCSKYHLFFDEFDYFRHHHSGKFKDIVNKPWKSITLISSLVELS